MALTQVFQGARRAVPAIDAQAFFDAFGIGKSVREYRRSETIFRQGDACDDVLYVQSGGVKLSVGSKTHGEVVLVTLGPGDFFGEACLTGQPVRLGTATAVTPSVIRLVGRRKMIQLLHTHPAMCDRFIANMLSRTMRMEEDLAKQLFKTNDKRGNL
jgi:CRP/FNR family cyclic AMP-dependent transcriptional regulator